MKRARPTALATSERLMGQGHAATPQCPSIRSNGRGADIAVAIGTRLQLRGWRAIAPALLALTSVLAAGAGCAQLSAEEAAVQRVHERAVVIDAHADLPAPYDWTAGNVPQADDDQISPARLKTGKVDAQVIAVFVPQGPQTPEAIATALTEAERKALAIRLRAESDPQNFVLATTADEIVAAAETGRTAIVMSLLNAYPLQSSLQNLDAFFQLGVRIIGLTHAGNNGFADSSRPHARDRVGEHGGLSPAGHALITRANQLGILIDVSQLSEQATLQAVALSSAPVIASHSGLATVVPHARNLSDRELAAIEAKGGVVAINAFSSYLLPVPPESQRQIAAARARFGAVNGYEGLTPEQRAALGAEIQALTPRASVRDLVESIDYAVERVGINHVAISSDFNHGGGITGWSNAGEAANVTAELLRRGYSATDVAKLWGGNFLRVLRAAQAAATQTPLTPAERAPT